MFSISVRCPEVLTAQGVIISAEAYGQVKVSTDETLLHRAVENFLSKGSSGITSTAQEVLEGHMRAALGTISVEEISTERDAFARRVRDAAAEDFNRLGLELLSFSLKDISDSQGYLSSLGARRIAEVKRDAAIAQAEADRDATIRAAEYRKEGDIARLGAEAELAEATRDFEVQRADFQASVNVKRAQADVAYDLEKAKLAEELKRQEYGGAARREGAGRQGRGAGDLRREKELEATVKRPAEAMQLPGAPRGRGRRLPQGARRQGKAAGIRLMARPRPRRRTAAARPRRRRCGMKAAPW